jgi:outer membrane receptor for ferrienterochelin and colicin
MKFTKWLTFLLIFYLLLSAVRVAAEEEKVEAIPEILVETERQIREQGKITIRSEGLPAEVNIVTQEDLERMSIKNPEDMLRLLPGVSINSFSSQGVGIIVQMRGFLSGFGRDTAIFIDDMPVNFVHGMEGNG